MFDSTSIKLGQTNIKTINISNIIPIFVDKNSEYCLNKYFKQTHFLMLINIVSLISSMGIFIIYFKGI